MPAQTPPGGGRGVLEQVARRVGHGLAFHHAPVGPQQCSNSRKTEHIPPSHSVSSTRLAPFRTRACGAVHFAYRQRPPTEYQRLGRTHRQSAQNFVIKPAATAWARVVTSGIV